MCVCVLCVCVCACVTPEMLRDKHFQQLKSTGAGHHIRVPAQRSGSHVDAEAVWDARLCTCSVGRTHL